MNSLPNLSESTVRARASAQTWVRGHAYFDSGQVKNLIWRTGLLTAEVQGSGNERYQVTANFTGDQLEDVHCTCPYDMDGDCKHSVAVLLTLIHHPDEIAQHSRTSAMLAAMNREQMSGLITQLVELHPQLVKEIERLLPTLPAFNAAPSAAGSAPVLPAIDTTMLRRQIVAELGASINTGYDSWGEEAWYDSDLGAALQPGLAQVRIRLAAGDAQGALTLLEAITGAWQEGVDSLDEYFLEYFSDSAGEFTGELGEMWAEAILLAEMDEDERLSWAETMEHFSASIFGGESLDIAITAAEQGWDYPPLQEAMGGHITDQGAWEGESPDFADELARIRLAILERRGEYEAYLNLAQAEGQLMLYLHMLAKRGQSDQAVDQALEFLERPTDLDALARTVAEQGEIEKAIQLARYGLDLTDNNGKAELAAWLRDLARDNDQPDLALWAAQQALTHHVSLENYRAVADMAGDSWAAIKSKILSQVTEGRSTAGKVDVYLYEGMHAEAIAVVDSNNWFYDIDKVIETVKGTHPEWAFHQCQRRAADIMDAGQSNNYDVAAKWVRRGRDILLTAGLDSQWQVYINHLMEVHRRKYKLMPMLRLLV